jgi:hypothetical protein
MEWRAFTETSVVLTALLFSILILFLSRVPLVGFVLVGLLYLGLWRYGYAVLRSTAQNRKLLEPPTIGSFNPFSEWTLIGHFVVFPLLIFAVTLWAPFGSSNLWSAFAFSLILLIAFVFPASAAVLAFTSNLAQALNPSALRSFVRIVGHDYWKLLAAIVGVAVAASAAVWLLNWILGDFSTLAVQFVLIWSGLGVFALIGSSVRSHGDDFVIPGAKISDVDYEAGLREKSWRLALDAAYGSIRSGHVSEGYKKISELVAENEQGLRIQFWIFNEMIDWEDRTHAVRFGYRLIESLVAEDDIPAAIEIYRRCRPYAITDARMAEETSAKLAAFARNIGQHGIAEELGGIPATGRQWD